MSESNNVQRYDLSTCGLSDGEKGCYAAMEEWSSGDYVKYDDYVKLYNRLNKEQDLINAERLIKGPIVDAYKLWSNMEE